MDKLANLVDNAGAALGALRGNARLRAVDRRFDNHVYAHGSTPQRSDASASVDNAERVPGSLPESVLMEGYGVCGRCTGSGHVPASILGDPHRLTTCPRCGGTGRKGR